MARKNKKGIEPEVVYRKEGRADGVVPSKTYSYKIDKETGENISIPPKTHTFENALKKEIAAYLSTDSSFPTKEPVFVSIVHGLHSERGFDECDLDNRAKTILDALKSCVYEDDKQVHMLWTQKLFLKQEQESYYHIAIKTLNSDVSTSDITNNIHRFV